MRKIPVARLESLFGALRTAGKLYLPVDTDAGAQYLLWREGMALSRATNTVRSPKEFFFPQTETLMEFKTEGKKIGITDIRSESEDFILFGVRACDVRSFEVLDRVFLSEPADTYYQNRREHGVIFSLACSYPAETCFCGTFGVDASAPGGDVAMWFWGDMVYLVPQTEKGARVLSCAEAVTSPCDPEDTEEREAARAQIRDRLERLPLADLCADGFGEGKTKQLFDSPAWETLSRSCLGCGACTFVCPTCQCYDIRDFKTADGVMRYRCWDSCMYSEFTKMSAGQPRLTQKERFRQRFLHKLVYFPENNHGVFSCVGCGRCISACPIHMNIVKVMKTLGGEGENHVG